MKKTLTFSLISAFFISQNAVASIIMRSVQCKAMDTVQMNRFTVEGTVEISDKGQAGGDLTVTTQMAGADAPVSEPISLTKSTGTSRVYPARSLGVNEVTLVRLKSEYQGRVYSLTIASGLLGPQSTLTVQGIPFRAECKLN